jgi:hypothetical protein
VRAAVICSDGKLDLRVAPPAAAATALGVVLVCKVRVWSASLVLVLDRACVEEPEADE